PPRVDVQLRLETLRQAGLREQLLRRVRIVLPAREGRIIARVHLAENAARASTQSAEETEVLLVVQRLSDGFSNPYVGERLHVGVEGDTSPLHVLLPGEAVFPFGIGQDPLDLRLGGLVVHQVELPLLDAEKLK